jgi:hypothetical protein
MLRSIWAWSPEARSRRWRAGRSPAGAGDTPELVRVAGERVITMQPPGACLEIAGDRVRWVHDNAPWRRRRERSRPAADRLGYDALPDAIPEGVRFLRRRDRPSSCLRTSPGGRTVRWLTDDSPEPKGGQCTGRFVWPFRCCDGRGVFRGRAHRGPGQFIGRAHSGTPDDNPAQHAERGCSRAAVWFAGVIIDLAPAGGEKIREIREHVGGRPSTVRLTSGPGSRATGRSCAA